MWLFKKTSVQPKSELESSIRCLTSLCPIQLIQCVRDVFCMLTLTSVCSCDIGMQDASAGKLQSKCNDAATSDLLQKFKKHGPVTTKK
jgi:hypothetical protein